MLSSNPSFYSASLSVAAVGSHEPGRAAPKGRCLMRWKLSALSTALSLVGFVALAQGPAPVSPGDESEIVTVWGGCPTFTWTLAEGAETVELEVYRVPADEADGPLERELAVSLPGSAQAWTPALAQCPGPGARYAWSVRSTALGVHGEWSRPWLFEIAAGPSDEEVRTALATLRRYLGERESSSLEPPQQQVPGVERSGLPSTLLSSSTGAREGTLHFGLDAVAADPDLFNIGVRGRGAGAGVYGTSDGIGVFGIGPLGGYFSSPVGAGRGLLVRGTACCSGAIPENHAALVSNVSQIAGADVLALTSPAAVPAQGTNFITFFGDGNVIGEIQGDGAGGIEFDGSVVGPASDFAEYLLKLDANDRLEPGDVVGLSAGRVSLHTAAADRAMVVSTRPIVAAGLPRPEDASGYAIVAFLGQVPVKVRGPVAAGDLLVPSGLEDGTAVATRELSVHQARLVIGRAQEDSSGVKEVETVKTLVGLAEMTAAGVSPAAAREPSRYAWLVLGMLLTGIVMALRRSWNG